ncbi:hypothetical protein BH24GEM2_BH24GEM2_16050 [soil metagenome]
MFNGKRRLLPAVAIAIVALADPAVAQLLVSESAPGGGGCAASQRFVQVWQDGEYQGGHWLLGEAVNPR